MCKSAVLTWEQFLPQSDKCLQTFLILTAEEEVCSSCILGRGQGCCPASYSAQDSPPQPTVTPPNRPVLTNPGISGDKSPSLLSSVVELGHSSKVLEEVNPSLSNTYNVYIGSSKSLKLKEPLHLLDLASQFLPSTPYKL